jgi:hypothetical protein
MKKNPTMLSTTHQKTPWTITQPRAVSVYHDDNHELVQLFDEVVFVQQPWWSTTPRYNLSKSNASTPIVTFVGFQNHPPNTNINLIPTNSEMEWLHLFNKLE